MSGFKREADVPLDAARLGGCVSKADLLEAAYHLASLCHDGGCDDEEANVARLKHEIDVLRANRGVKPLKVPPPMTAEDRNARHAACIANYVAQGGKL